jgi:hypothetical protein
MKPVIKRRGRVWCVFRTSDSTTPYIMSFVFRKVVNRLKLRQEKYLKQGKELNT